MEFNQNSSRDPGICPVDNSTIQTLKSAFDGYRSTINVGDAELYVLELAASYNINENWSLGGNLTLSNSTFDDYCSIAATNNWNAAMGGARTFADEILTPADDGVVATCAPVDGNDLPHSSPVKGAFDVTAYLVQPRRPREAGINLSYDFEI